MPLPEPRFDSRTYRELLDEALARIPSHNPEWTNRTDTDPGVTLLQLFAFMTESLLYRANRIPERNRQKFLRLLGLQMRPAAPARGLVEFRNPRGPFEVITLAEDQEVGAGNVSFRTENGLQILPIETRLYFKRPLTNDRKGETEALYRKLDASFDLPDADLDFYETAIFEPAARGVILHSLDIATQTQDGALWLALLARPSETPEDARRLIANKVLSLGIVPALDEEGCVLYPTGPAATQKRPSLLFELPNARDERISYQAPEVTRGHDPLARPGLVKIRLPEADGLRVGSEGPS